MFDFFVFILGKLSGGPPKVIPYTRPQNRHARIGDNVTFDCLEILSGTIPDVRWFHVFNEGDQSILPDIPKHMDWNNINNRIHSFEYKYIPANMYTTFKLKSSNHTPRNDFLLDDTDPFGLRLTLYNVKKNDTGTYTCYVSNYEGNDYSTFSLIVS